MASVCLENPLSFGHVSLETIRPLLAPPPGPCLSLYLPTHRRVPDKLVDRPAYRHLVEALELALGFSLPRAAVDRLLEPFRALDSDAGFWDHTREGLAILSANGKGSVFLMPVPPKPLALVTSGFHTLPLVRLAAATERFNVLTLTSRAAHVYEGCTIGAVAGHLDPVPLQGLASAAAEAGAVERGDVIDEETFQPHRVQHGMGPSGLGYGSIVHGGAGSRQDDIDADTEIFLRHVDEVVHERVSRHSCLPLVLVALPKLAALFRRLTKNRLLLDDGVAKDVHLLPPADLLNLVTPVFAAAHKRRIDRELDRFAEARDHGLGSGDLSDIARAAAAGRVATLLIEKDRFEPGWLDRATGAIAGDGEPAGQAEDLFGAVAETVLVHGGGIVALDRIRMPTESGVAAIYRYE